MKKKLMNKYKSILKILGLFDTTKELRSSIIEANINDDMSIIIIKKFLEDILENRYCNDSERELYKIILLIIDEIIIEDKQLEFDNLW